MYGGDVKILVEIKWITILTYEQFNEVFKGRRHVWMMWFDVAKNKQCLTFAQM